jgi:hypothetical protein
VQNQIGTTDHRRGAVGHAGLLRRILTVALEAFAEHGADVRRRRIWRWIPGVRQID